MAEQQYPLLIETEQLANLLGDPGLLIIDLSKASTHAHMHIPGAVPLDYGHIVSMKKPVGGLLPDEKTFSEALSAIGFTPEHHVVVYDDEGGGKACRLIWTFDAIGFTNYSLLNGGLHAWANEGRPLTKDQTPLTPSQFQATIQHDAPGVAKREYILEHLDDPQVALLDARSPAEYCGEQKFAMRAGHIPGAVNIEWTLFMDQDNNLCLKPEAELRAMLEAAGFSRDKTVVAYCQTHHRSAHTYFVLKYLGYDALGYEGSWSDWGNQSNTPIEI